MLTTRNNQLLDDEEQQPLVAASARRGGGGNDAAAPVASSSYDSTTNGQNKNVDVQHDDAPPTLKAQEDGGFSRGHALLLVVAILYGTLNVSLRGVYALPDPPSPSALSTIRGWLAVLCFAPFLIGKKTKKDEEEEEKTRPSSSSCSTRTPTQSQSSAQRRTTTKTTLLPLWIVAAELAVWNFGAQALVNVGLLYIESARAAFLTQLSVVMTPCLAALCDHKIHANVWYACAIALCGLVFMSKKEHGGDLDDGGSGDDDDDDDSSNSFTLGFGDILCLCGALSWSTYLFRLSAVGELYDEIYLQATKTLLLAILYSIWCGIEVMIHGGESPWSAWASSLMAWVLLFYSALGPGTVADVLQQKGQSTVTATVANIILSLEPVFTALFGRMLLGELTTWMEKVGGCLILTAAVVATFKE